MTRSRHILPPRRYWAPWEDQLLREFYPHWPTAWLAPHFGRRAPALHARAHLLGLRKSAAFLSSGMAGRTDGERGKSTRFAKGHVSANKGLRRPGWAPGRMAATQFKPGRLPAKHMPVGSTRLVDGYQYTKVSDVRKVAYTVNWKPTHLLLWQKHRGPVPRGHCLIFRDGNRDNITLANLECISRKENMLRNSIHNMPEPLPELVRLRGVLTRTINRRKQQ